jgi:hypothetical protein
MRDVVHRNSSKDETCGGSRRENSNERKYKPRTAIAGRGAAMMGMHSRNSATCTKASSEYKAREYERWDALHRKLEG